MINLPIVKAEMLIRRPVEEVFEAFVNPEVTTKFWFTKSSGRLETEKLVTWDWEMYGVSDQVYVEDLQLNKRILIKSSDSTKTEWVFDSRTNKETFVTIVNSGFKGNEDDIVNQAVDSMGGYTMVLCALKALLEHNVILNAVFDKAPDAHTK
ncbi:uncharacterized protein YndB with AHSA1/START domain [Cytobacillus horneckiae]